MSLGQTEVANNINNNKSVKSNALVLLWVGLWLDLDLDGLDCKSILKNALWFGLSITNSLWI